MEDLGYAESVFITSCVGKKLQTSIKITCSLILTHSLEGGDIVYISTIITPVITTCYTRCFLNRRLLNKYIKEENVDVE